MSNETANSFNIDRFISIYWTHILTYIISINENVIPQKFEISNIYPNPFNPVTTIHYRLTQNTDVIISIYDINGRLITALINEFQTAGYHSIKWDASNFSSSIYLLNLSSGKFTETQKLVLIK